MEGKQSIHFDFNNMMADTIGPEHGITEQELKTLELPASRYMNDVKEERNKGKLPFLDLPYQKNIAAEIIETTNTLKGKFKNVVVV
ncbi:MAG: glucose-6-phosphate isomerase, partial [Planctomycetes bacterium]|nr:glucose-6-phosphate isomerase [Planctomycetota bacterium]